MAIGIDKKWSKSAEVHGRTRKMDFTAFSSKDLTTTVMKGVGPGAAVDSSSSQAFNQSCFFFFFFSFLKYLIVGSALVVWSHPTGAMRCGSVVAVAGHGMRHEQVCSCSALRRSPAEPFPAHHPDVFRGQPCFSLPPAAPYPPTALRCAALQGR